MVKYQIFLISCGVGGASQLLSSYYLSQFPQSKIIETSTLRGKLRFVQKKLLNRLARRGLLDGGLVGIGSSSILLLIKKSQRQKFFNVLKDAVILNTDLKPVLVEPVSVLPWYKRFFIAVYKTRKVYKVVLFVYSLWLIQI
jgi:hypothetical protein